MAPVQLVGPVGGQQHDPDPAQRPDQERDQLSGGLVGPVQVLQHQQQRPAGAEPAQQSQDELEQLGYLEPVGGRVRALVLGQQSARVELGQQAAQAAPGGAEYVGQFGRCRGAGQRAQRVDERGERQALRAELDAVAGQGAVKPESAARRQPVTRRSLAAAGLARDDREPGSPSAARRSRAASDSISSRRPTKTGLWIGSLIPCTVPQPVRAREPGTGNTRISRLLVRHGGRAEPGDMTTTTDSLVRSASARW